MIEVLPDKNYLMIQLSGGVGNRLRAMLSAVWLAEQTKRTPVVFWLSKINCKAGFLDLFDGETAKRLNVFSREPYNRECDLAVRAQYCTLEMAMLPVPRVLMRTNKTIGDKKGVPWAKLFARFGLNAYVSSAADRPMQEYVGVHVRRGDNVNTSIIPLERYFSVVDHDSFLADGARKFFLATDDLDVENAFRDRYGDRLVTFKKRTRARNKRRGIQDAFVDMLLLSKCHHIYGSSLSSFPRMASRIGVTPFKDVGQLVAALGGTI